jgi:hypothetical protein
VEFDNLTSTVANGIKTGALSEPSIRCVLGSLLPEPLHANQIRAAPPGRASMAHARVRNAVNSLSLISPEY